MAPSGPRSSRVRYNDLSVLRVRMAVIEGSSALLMWQLVSDNLLREHAWTQIVKKLRTALTLFSLIPLRLRQVSE